MGYKNIGTKLKRVLSKRSLNSKAKKAGFVKRSSSRISGHSFLVSMLSSVMKSEQVSLSSITEELPQAISKQALAKRFNQESVAFLSLVFKQLVEIRLGDRVANTTDLFSLFNRVIVFDSSAWDVSEGLAHQLPSNGGRGSKANAKLFLSYDFKTGSILDNLLLSGKCNDRNYLDLVSVKSCAGDLNIFDLGFYDIEYLHELCSDGAFFISRVTAQTIAFDPKMSSSINIPQALRKARQRGLNHFETEVVLGSRNPLQVRLVAARLPEEQANLKLAKLKKAQGYVGKTLSAEQKELCTWVVYVTNIPASSLSGEVVCQTYRIRWTIELVFKQLKSALKIDVVRYNNIHRLESEILIRLIITLLVMTTNSHVQAKLIKIKKEISLEKSFKLAKQNSNLMIQFVKLHLKHAIKYWQKIYNLTKSRANKEYSDKKPTSLARVFKAFEQTDKFEKIDFQVLLG